MKRKLTIFLMLMASVVAAAQTTKTTAKPNSAKKPTPPALSADFSKAAVKALVTISGDATKSVKDAAMVDAEAAADTPREQGVVSFLKIADYVHSLTLDNYSQAYQRISDNVLLPSEADCKADNLCSYALDDLRKQTACFTALKAVLKARDDTAPKACELK